MPQLGRVATAKERAAAVATGAAAPHGPAAATSSRVARSACRRAVAIPGACAAPQGGTKSFSLNLDPLDPYFAVLHEKASKIEEYLNKDRGATMDVGNPNYCEL